MNFESYQDLLERRRALRLDPAASHLERLVANTSCRKLCKYRQSRLLEAAQGRRSLKRYRRDFLDYRVPLTTLLNEDGIRTSSRQMMESITKRFYTNLCRSSTPVSNLLFPLEKCHQEFYLLKYAEQADHEGSHGSATGPCFG
ncbi:unnamed protein product [Strongylus vulgaris]|uniref:Uncharacterized protein n=1 Tax=Strongylus vulgaris TaxID=40348 RepID=A0A3P7L8G0_STRVU|nr:unnamed protein product [Strongylus vulgaris]